MSRFEWDEEKNRANRRKHGIGFEEASAIFDGPVLSLEDDRDNTDLRERSYGLLGGIVVVCVIHTERNDRIQMISVRKATSHERTLFHAYLKKTAR